LPEEKSRMLLYFLRDAVFVARRIKSVIWLSKFQNFKEKPSKGKKLLFQANPEIMTS